MKKVSIIVPVYNCEGHLDKCLNSIINQTYKNIEIILVNDGSTDNSLKVCKKYAKKDKRIVIINKENGGVSSARNVGINASTGYYIIFSDCDDILEPDEIEYMVSIIEKENVDVVRTNFSIKGYLGELTYDILGKLDRNGIQRFKKKIFSGEVPAYIWILLMRKDFILKNDLFFDEKLLCLEDTDFYVRLLNCVNSIFISNKMTYNYILYGLNNSINPKRYLKNTKNIIAFNKKINSLETNKNFIKSSNTCGCNMILEYLVNCIDRNLKDYKKELFIFMTTNDDFNRMIKNINYSKLKKHSKIVYKSIITKDYDSLSKNENVIKNAYSKREFYNSIDYKKRRIINKYIIRLFYLLKKKGNH